MYFFCIPGYDSESDDDLAITSDELTDRDKLLISQINKIWELEVAELLESLEKDKETNNNNMSIDTLNKIKNLKDGNNGTSSMSKNTLNIKVPESNHLFSKLPPTPRGNNGSQSNSQNNSNSNIWANTSNSNDNTPFLSNYNTLEGINTVNFVNLAQSK